MNVHCPQCSADFKIEQPDMFFGCPYCSNSLYVDIKGVVQVFSFARRLSDSEVGLFVGERIKNLVLDLHVEISEPEKVWVPFWGKIDNKRIFSASAAFPEDSIAMPVESPLGMDMRDCLIWGEVLDIATEPETDEALKLFYVPFYRGNVKVKKQKYPFFCNAVNGEVAVENISVEPGRSHTRMFRIFLSLFIVSLFVSFVFDNPLLVVAANVTAGYLTYQFTLPLIESRSRTNDS